MSHGLLLDAPPRSVEVLQEWCEEHGIKISRGIEVRDGEGGWGVFARRDYELGQILCQVPKTSLLSMRTSSLRQSLPEEQLNLTLHGSHTILYLALALLHELRLAQESPFWGYLQSLPRETILLPAFWGIEDLAGEDGRKGLAILAGTEAERDILHKNNEGLSIDDVRQFYYTLAPHLPPTTKHPDPSPFLAYIHAYSLICTRAFLIDLYHTIALCPFADLFNHSSSGAHTSLSADDFVCHVCGSLKECSHDIPSTTGIVRRLEHLPELEQRRLAKEEDTVDLKTDWNSVKKGEEVFNSYGENMGDGRLLVEWGFVEEDSTGGNVTFLPEELGNGVQPWQELLEVHVDEDEDRLIGQAPADRPWSLALDTEGAIGINVIAAIALGMVDTPIAAPSESIQQVVSEIESVWRKIEDDEDVDASASLITISVVHFVVDLLEKRLTALFRPDLSLEQLFNMRNNLEKGNTLQRMALSVLLNERRLLESSREKWSELLAGLTPSPA